ncbi:MAG: hypothetical protein AB1Z98_26235 [Nannocystaceae bacterium]
MSTRRCLLTLAALPLLLIPLGCATQHDEPVPEPSAARDGQTPLDGRRIEVTLPAQHSSLEQVHAIVEHLEGQADVAGAKAAVHASADGEPTALTVDLWGQDMPSDEVFEADLRAEFPFLVEGSVVVGPVDGDADSLPGAGAHDEEDPEVLREQIIADLRAQGVEGEIDVTITDGPDGRREVQVEVHDDEPPA